MENFANSHPTFVLMNLHAFFDTPTATSGLSQHFFLEPPMQFLAPPPMCVCFISCAVCVSFWNPTVPVARWAHMRHFLSVCSLSVCLDLTEMGENYSRLRNY